MQDGSMADAKPIKLLIVDDDEDTAALLRDVLGNPFRPVAVDQSWLTPAVVRLAQSIYDGRAALTGVQQAFGARLD
jgi:response regulator RpfG family c-di-GMP phosphodiesterase